MSLKTAARAFESFWWKPRPTGGPMTHDYRIRGPGHDFTFDPLEDGQRGFMMGWGAGICRGDFLLLPHKGTSTRYRVTRIEYYLDPPDMWTADVAFDPRPPREDS